jgi:hypothetical protein
VNQHSEEWVLPDSIQGLFDPRRIADCSFKASCQSTPTKGTNMPVTQILDSTLAESASNHVLEHRPDSLSGAVEQLAGLRFSILLSAKWLGSGALTGHARTELQDELRQLRTRYSNKIDEIAINYGVRAAMLAQAGVEREVGVPKNMAPLKQSECDGFHDV